MIWLIVGAVVLLGLFWLGRLKKLNRDPSQQAIASLIMEMVAEDFSWPAQDQFTLESSKISRAASGMKLSNRLPHALSMVRPMLTPAQYEKAREVVREISLSASKFGN